MKTFSKKLLALTSVILVIYMVMQPIEAYANTPYKTYTIDGYGDVVETQTSYMPYRSITKIGEVGFTTPVDLKIVEDKMYVADSGDKCIIVADLEGNYINTIGDGVLTGPTGVFVTPDKRIYVADKDAGKIVVFDEKGNVLQEYTKPTEPLYGDNVPFKPQKIVVNSSGNMYIICEGNTNGIVQISPVDGGTFLGYFGTNYTTVSFTDILKRLVFTDAQRAKMLSNLPSTPGNLWIDQKGLIYTITQGAKDLTLRKLNIAGNNLIEPDAYDTLPAAVTTGNYENIFMASSDGYVYEFNEDGELLFVFGGRDDGRNRIGLCSKVEAIAVDNDNKVYLLDSDKMQIQIFETTEFTDLLHESLYLFSKGRYTESKEPLTQVLEMNSMFDYANMAMGRAYLQEENYDMALHYSELAKDFDGYSDAFWEVRNIWIRAHLVEVFFIIVLIIILIKLLKYIHKKTKCFDKILNFKANIDRKTITKQLKYLFYFLKHPIDGSYGVRFEGKCSWLCSAILMIGFIIINIINKYGCGFLLKTVREGRYDIISDIGYVLIIFFGLTICNYLVCTISDGEGSFKQMVNAYLYALAPYFVLKPFIIIVSNVVTYNEVFIVQFANLFMYSWIAILLFLAIKEINNYTVKETLKIIGLTAFTALIAALLIFIIYVLCRQVVEFIIAISGEVVYRIGS